MERMPRPAYAGPSAVARKAGKIKPGNHSFTLDFKVSESDTFEEVFSRYSEYLNAAREYNIAHKKEYDGRNFLDSSMVIFYGRTKDNSLRASSTMLIATHSTNAQYRKYVEKAYYKVTQSDAKIKFARIVFDVYKIDMQKQAQKKAERAQPQARLLNQAKQFKFSNYNDYLNALKHFNKTLKHGASEKKLKQHAERIAKQRAKVEAAKLAAKRSKENAARNRAILKRENERLKELRNIGKAQAKNQKSIAKNSSKITKRKNEAHLLREVEGKK